MIQPGLIWELARKDLLLFATDRRGVLLFFGVPILLASAFGAIFYRSDDAPPRPRVFVVCEDKSPTGQAIVQALCQSEQVQASSCSLVEGQRRQASEASSLLVVLPRGIGQLSWQHCSATADRPSVEIWYHPRAHWESRWVEGVVTEIVFRESARALLPTVLRSSSDAGLERPFHIARRPQHASGALSVHSFSHSFCGMTLQYLLFWGMDSGLLLLRERRQGIWRRLRAAPVSRLTLLSGKALATALLALAQIAVTFLFGSLVFGVTITGSWVGFALMAVAAALLSAATGLLVAALGGNEGRARSVAILVILTLSLLGGLWLPAFLLPTWAQNLSLALPTTWAARGLEGVTWQHMSFTQVWPCALILVGFSAVFLAIAWWRLNASEGETA